MNFKDLMVKYSENTEFINNLNLRKIKKIGIFLLAYLVSIILFFAPVVFIYHFMMYKFYQNLILLIICLLFVGFFIVGEIIYHRLLLHFSNSEKRSFKINHIINLLVYLIFCLIGYLVIILIFK